jgi:hypothetical protein
LDKEILRCSTNDNDCNTYIFTALPLALANGNGINQDTGFSPKDFLLLEIYSALSELVNGWWTFTPGFTGGYSYLALSEPVVIIPDVQKKSNKNSG